MNVGAGELPPAVLAHPRLAQWLRADDDGGFTVFTGKVELGQGIETALRQLAADALGVAPARLRLVAGDTGCAPDEGYTAGSLSVSQGGAALRWACGHARALQEQAGTAAWADARIDHAPPPGWAPGPWLGAALPRDDLPAKLHGAAYVHDLERPGMRHARVLRPPHPSQRWREVPEAMLAALPGVERVVRSGRFVALVGPHEGRLVRAWAQAHKRLQATPLDLPAVADGGAAAALDAAAEPPHTVYERGTPRPGTQRVAARYSRPYLAHASIGPSCAVAEPGADGVLTVWTHSQGVYPLRDALAAALRRPPGSVRVVHRPGAGCYGHNGADDVAFDAAFIATCIGAPVRVQWMREDEMTQSPFGAAGAVALEAALDADGAIAEWRLEVTGPTHMARPGWSAEAGVQLLGAWETEPPAPVPPPRDLPLPAGGALRNALALYTLPHERVDHRFVASTPVRTSALRSLGSHLNLFAIESFVDELADAAGADPLDFRLRHLDDPRARTVLQALATRCGWAARGEAGSGEGLGLAVGRYKNVAAWCAVAVRVRLEETVRVTDAWAVVDAGLVVNPDGVRNQVEGGLLQALSWTLKEQVRWDADGITSRDWANYPVLGFDEVPALDVQLVERPGDTVPLGVGEVAAGPAAAAVGNAVAHALGLRVRDLPLTAERIAAAIDAA